VTESRYGLLTVLSVDSSNPKYRCCRCACGTEKRVRIDHLRTGKTISCGCEARRLSSKRAHVMHKANTRTGLSDSPTYQAWLGMKQRCGNPKSKYFSYYGGRGIKVCDRWIHSFENFLTDMGERPSPKHSLDRYPDNNGNYEPGNCRWATKREQQLNRRNNRLITYDGTTQTLLEWSEAVGIHKNTLDQRLAAGWDVERALTTPADRTITCYRPGLALGGMASGAKKRAMTHCKRGHILDEANTRITPQGTRVCRACHRYRQNRRNARNRVNHS